MKQSIDFKKLTVRDLPFLNEVRNECCEKYLHDSTKYSLNDTIQWFYNTNPMFWIIKLDGQRVGYFRTSNYSKVNKNIYIGGDLHKDYRGKGIAYNAYCKFIPYIFKEFDLHKISLEVLETNGIAIKLYEKLGFIEEGRKREEVKKGGMYFDSIIMSILRKDSKFPIE